MLLLPLAFVLGGLTGMWGPSEKLRAMKTASAAGRGAAAKTQPIDSFTRMINIPDVARKHRRPADGRATPSPEDKGSAAEDSAEAPGKSAPGRPPARRLGAEDLESRIKEASELWRTRMEMVRANQLKTLDLDENGAARFDAELAKMNADIRSSVQALADAIAEEGAMNRELGVRFMGEISISIAETYDRIGECVGADGRDKVSDLQLMELIDPSVAEPLIGVQGKIGEFGRAIRPR
jgi:hypothetical protein